MQGMASTTRVIGSFSRCDFQTLFENVGLTGSLPSDETKKHAHTHTHTTTTKGTTVHSSRERRKNNLLLLLLLLPSSILIITILCHLPLIPCKLIQQTRLLLTLKQTVVVPVAFWSAVHRIHWHFLSFIRDELQRAAHIVVNSQWPTEQRQGLLPPLLLYPFVHATHLLDSFQYWLSSLLVWLYENWCFLFIRVSSVLFNFFACSFFH
jgi:hypothetical protein